MLRGELADLKETVNTGEVGPLWPRARLSCLLCCFCFSFLVPHTPQCLFYSPDSVGFKSFLLQSPCLCTVLPVAHICCFVHHRVHCLCVGHLW